MGKTTKLDLTGQRFGKLTVLVPAKNIGNRTAWHCRCDCGKEIIAKTVHLRSGHVKSCGCTAIRERLTLVEGTCIEMLQSEKIRKNNSSGVTGVHWSQREQCWCATICFQGRRKTLGRFKELEDAIRARKQAEEETHKAFLQVYRKENG